jgi:lactose/L-arabinose transport system permease protein
MSTNGTLQLFDESLNITDGGPGTTGSATMSHHIFRTAFEGSPQFGYAAAMSFTILLFVAILAIIQIKVADRRD